MSTKGVARNSRCLEKSAEHEKSRDSAEICDSVQQSIKSSLLCSNSVSRGRLVPNETSGAHDIFSISPPSVKSKSVSYVRNGVRPRGIKNTTTQKGGTCATDKKGEALQASAKKQKSSYNTLHSNPKTNTTTKHANTNTRSPYHNTPLSIRCGNCNPPAKMRAKAEKRLDVWSSLRDGIEKGDCGGNGEEFVVFTLLSYFGDAETLRMAKAVVDEVRGDGLPARGREVIRHCDCCHERRVL